MQTPILQESNYKEEMQTIVEPYLVSIGTEFYLERHAGQKIHCMHYVPENPHAVVMLSHGFIENAEKYKEIAYYFAKEGFSVYLPEHCGHGFSYRLTEDESLVHLDSFERYVEDFIFVTKKAKEDNPGMKIYLYGHSMGGGIAAAVAARVPEMFEKVILSSPMIRPLTGGVPWHVAKAIAKTSCKVGRNKKYVVGQKPYKETGKFEESCSLSRPRFEYYEEKRTKEAHYHLNAPSYGWLGNAMRLNRYLEKTGWKKIEAPVMLFSAGKDNLVSNAAQERFVRKLNKNRPESAELVKFPESKHEIFNAENTIAEEYWKKVFDFFES